MAAATATYTPPSSTATESAIYFGTFPVHLSVVPGEVTVCRGARMVPEEGDAARAKASARMEPLASLGEGYEFVYVNCIPNHDIQVVEASKEVSPIEGPLIKTDNGTLVGIRSGGRSALFQSGGKWYRLKGCGNYVDDEGFRFPFPGIPTQTMEMFGQFKGTEIRGVCFEHTAYREEYMCGRIGEVAAQNGIQVGNIAEAVWKYNIESAPLPRVHKFCAVFRTLGERRLASHLLVGLELLLPFLYPNVSCGAVNVTEGRRDGSGAIRATYSACCKARPLPLEDISMVALGETAPSPTVLSEVSPFFADHLSHVTEACAKLTAVFEASKSSRSGNHGDVLPSLYYRLGVEAGAFQRTLADAHISWGYYIDHNEFEPHCNAHPNNFVVVAPSEGGSRLLAPVDFDMAFEKKFFFSTVRETPTYLMPDDSLFDSWSAMEKNELELALAGEEVSTGLLGFKSGQGLNAEQTDLRWLLRDMLVRGFRAGFEDCRSSLVPPHTTAAGAAHIESGYRALVDLALMASADRAS